MTDRPRVYTEDYLRSFLKCDEGEVERYTTFLETQLPIDAVVVEPCERNAIVFEARQATDGSSTELRQINWSNPGSTIRDYREQGYSLDVFDGPINVQTDRAVLLGERLGVHIVFEGGTPLNKRPGSVSHPDLNRTTIKGPILQ